MLPAVRTLAGFLGLSFLVAAQPPEAIARLGMGLRMLATRDLDLDVPCRALADASGNPMLLWALDQARPLALVQERIAAERWLLAHAGVLGFSGFEPVFARSSAWHGCDVWTYGLVRDGLLLFDAEVSLYFADRACIGLLNRMPKVTGLPAASAPRPEGRAVLFARRDTPGVILLAAVREQTTTAHRITEVVHEGAVLHRIQEQLHWPTTPQAATITEFTFPGMNYPDQIWADSKGLIWFSEPLVGRVSRFNPTTNTFQSFATPGFRGNDGLQVDDRDRVWFGLVANGHGLGVIDATTGVFTRYAPPYAGAQMAVPTQTSRGTILVTDHLAERISEFDPNTGTWIGAITMPAGSFPTGGMLEPETGDVWYPLWTFHGLGRWRPGASTITRIATPSASGPAFCGVHDGRVYISYGLTNRLGVYDIRSGTFTEHVWRAGELGGPIAMAPNGHAVVGTRNRGYIVVFDPVTLTFTDYLIPTANPGLKDGLTVAPDGVIWFTETLNAHKIAKLVLP